MILICLVLATIIRWKTVSKETCFSRALSSHYINSNLSEKICQYKALWKRNVLPSWFSVFHFPMPLSTSEAKNDQAKQLLTHVESAHFKDPKTIKKSATIPMAYYRKISISRLWFRLTCFCLFSDFHTSFSRQINREKKRNTPINGTKASHVAKSRQRI